MNSLGQAVGLSLWGYCRNWTSLHLSHTTQSKAVNMNIDWLLGETGRDITARARQIDDPLEAATKLRKLFAEVPADLVSQAINQASLQKSLRSRWSMETDGWLLTADGIEQATRPTVATWRANWIVQKFGPAVKVIDLTCGLGFDSLAMAQAGLKVCAIERDQFTAACARHNLENVEVDVLVADANDVDLEEFDLFFIDPMRRDPNSARELNGNTKRILKPDDWSPSWSEINQFAKQGKVLCKIAPGIADQYIVDWDTFWISDAGDVVEAMALSAGTGKRSAVLISGSHFEIFSEGGIPPVAGSGQFLVVPNGALTRAGELSALCTKVNGGLINEHIGWILTNDRNAINHLRLATIKLAETFHVIDRVKADTKVIARAISGMDASAITIMTRGVQVEVPKLRKQIAPKLNAKAPELVIALFREDSGNQALICRRINELLA